MLSSEPLLRTIKIVGSRQEIIKMLGISPQRLDSWLNGGIAMGYEYALALEYLTCGQVTTTDLVPHKAQLLKKLKINLSTPITWLVRRSIPITTISIPDDFFANNTNHLEELAEDIKQQGLLRPIVIDTNYSLVFGRKRLQANKLLGKKSITPLIIALEVMLKDPHAGYQLKKYFTLSEIIAIGIALETMLGKRQGKRNDLSLRPNSDEVKGRTDEFIADLLKLGSKNSYRLAKKVIQSGNRILIDLMDEEKISISAAASIIHLSVGEQQEILLGDPHLILEKMKQSKTNMAVASPEE